MDRAPRHSVIVDFIQHNERRWVVLEEDHEKALAEKDTRLAQMEALLRYFVENEHNHDENQSQRHMMFTEAETLLAGRPNYAEGYTPVRTDVVLFLLGLGREPFSAPDSAGAFWWRQHLHEAIPGGLEAMLAITKEVKP